jgi:hypothetical protein
MIEMFKNVRILNTNDNVHNDEYLHSCDNLECESALFICISTFGELEKDHVARHSKLNRGLKKCLFTYITKMKTHIPVDQTIDPIKVTKMIIGIESEFDANGSQRFRFEEKYSIYIHEIIHKRCPK